jgi:integrase/recombinase XerD
METTLQLRSMPAADLAAFAASIDESESTRRCYVKGAGAFLSWTRSAGIEAPKREDVIAFRDQLQAAGRAPATVNAAMTGTRQLFGFLEFSGLYPNVAANVKNLKRSDAKGHDALQAVEVRAVLDGIDTSTVRGLRDFALVNLLARTGIRSIEAIRADVGDIRRQEGEMVLAVHGKGRTAKDEIVVLTPEALKPITDYLAARGPVADRDPLFASASDRNAGGRLTTRSIRGTVKSYLVAAGYSSTRLSCHSLRHTAVSLAIEGGADLVHVQAMARHRDPRTTMLYFHDRNRIRNAAERFVKI